MKSGGVAGDVNNATLKVASVATCASASTKQNVPKATIPAKVPSENTNSHAGGQSAIYSATQQADDLEVGLPEYPHADGDDYVASPADTVEPQQQSQGGLQGDSRDQIVLALQALTPIASRARALALATNLI